jgi:hypothetical protein
MKRAFVMLMLVAGLLAACGGTGGGPGTSLAPFSPEVSPSLESAAPSESMEMSPEASPS